MSLIKNIVRLSVGLAVAAASAASLAEPIRIGVGIDAAFAPIFLAQQRGLFKTAGLDVEVVRFTQGGEAMDATVAGQTHIAASAEFSTMIRLPRGDLRPLARFEESGTNIKLVARPGITSVDQVKKFGVVKGSASEYSVQRALQTYKLDKNTVQLIPSAPPELPALMARGDIDAFFVWEPWPGIAVRQGGKVLATSGDVGYTFHMWLTANGPWFDANKAAAKKVLTVIEEANRQIIADPVKASQDLQAATKLPAADTVGYLKSTQWKVRDFSPQDIADYDQVADFLVAQKITPAKVDFRKALQVGFVKE